MCAQKISPAKGPPVPVATMILSGKHFSVGTGKSTAEVAEAPRPSTPFLLRRALAAGEEGREG